MKRFYSDVSVAASETGHEILLDGRSVKTPQRNGLVLPTRALAEAISKEWAGQGDKIDPAAMPFTALAQGTIDMVATDRMRIIDRIVAFGESDMLCYRADGGQAELMAEQAEAWDPILAWARSRYDVHFHVVEGIVHQPQPPQTLARLRTAVAAQDDFRLAAMLSAVGLAGSLVLTLALVEQVHPPEALWRHANLEELWQETQWGVDELAAGRRDQRGTEWANAAKFMRLLRE
ncbi:MAG: ATP12 family protein [Parasphingorhabdus sp.]|nr:ATP12 family protein [Parasphingorhabdus sp.]